MKKTVLTLATTFAIVTAVAQVPEKINYQGVARDNTGSIMATQPIGLRITIHQTSTTGPIVYRETHNITTNQFGLFNITIGSGTVISGSFDGIDWGADSYFTEVEMDETGGTSYLPMGTSQIVSVPYALYAKDAGSASCLTVATTQVFNGTSPTNWTEIDLSAAIGQNYAMVILKVINQSSTSGVVALFRQKGDTHDYIAGNDTNNMVSLGNSGVGQATIYTDSSGVIEWKTNNDVPVKLQVVAFTK